MNEIGIGVLWLILGLVVLIKGADYLIDGAAKGAVKLGVSELIIGLTVIAFGTGAPELFVSIQATLEGQSGMALGNVVGSNICNVTLILGVAAIMVSKPIVFDKMSLKRDFPAMILASGLLCYFVLNSNGIELVEAFILLAFLGVYLWGLVKDEGKSAELIEGELPDLDEAKNESWLKIILMLVGGLAALVVGSDRLIFGAVTIATALNVGETLIGLTVIALGTSLPELAATFSAVKKNKTDLIIGNVIGSNLFNILSVIGISALFGRLDGSQLNPLNDLSVMVALPLIIFVKVILKPHQLPKLFGGLLLFAYASYMFISFLQVA